MATNSLSSRLEELRSRNPQSPPSERAYSGYNTPTRYSGNFSTMHNHSQSVSTSSDPRTNTMQRRFTADANSFPTPLSPIGYQNMEVQGDVNNHHKAQALDRKRLELEKLREQKKRMEEEFMRLNNMQQEQESEVARLSRDLHTNNNYNPGHQSEPTTPPEYRDSSYYTPSMFTNRNRYSSASLTSTPGMNRMSRSGSQVTSPPNELAHPNGDSEKFPSHNHRYSMPVTLSARQKRESAAEFPSMGLTQIDTTSILFGDEDDKHDMVTSPAVKSYLQAHTTEDKFPVLLRSNHKPGTLSASSAALDLANLQASEVNTESTSNGWPSTFNRNRLSQQSLTQNKLEGRQAQHSHNSSQQSVETVIESPSNQRQANRQSLEATLASLSGQSTYNHSGTNGAVQSRPTLSNLPSSYSMSDLPTVKAREAQLAQAAHRGPPAHRQNMSLGRLPNNVMTNHRQSRDFVGGEVLPDEAPTSKTPVTSPSSDLQASAAPFGPASTSTQNGTETNGQSNAVQQQYDGQNYYPYSMSGLNMGVNQMHIGGMNGNGYMNGMQYYQPQQYMPQNSMQQQYPGQQQYANYNQYNMGGRFVDQQQKGVQQRRGTNPEGQRRASRRSSNTFSDPDTAKFSNAKIEAYVGEIYSLCKDQHGCRYLQKQLEARHPETVQTIFAETAPHVIELMTDPFGNYLCQKLLEHTNDAQRTTLVENAAPHMVQIALNQHGTRALQKMIEHLSTNEQIQVVRNALKDSVVELIQDLNGNHVIQKCLNRLSSEDSQFIFDAVGKNCVPVGTHRHGCCVLQRCIDHASGNQKAELIAQITSNAFQLIQDPYGNYVLQYILDMGDNNFTHPICYSLQTRVVEMSRHKFSSNVIEKCIRHSDPSVGSVLIEEMLPPQEIERMLRDSFANYVVQTALDHADAETRVRLVDAIRPILPSIRHTPHGRRIQSKVAQSRSSSQGTSPSMSPAPGPQIRGPGPMHRNGSGSHQNSYYGQQQPQGEFGMNGYNNQSGYSQMGGPVNGQRMTSNGNYQPFNPMAPQNGMHQGGPQGYGRGPQPPNGNGYNFF